MENDPIWDKPFFKRLAHNDTGQARGHQGGLVIPMQLRQFFPALVLSASVEQPTNERPLRAVLFVGNESVGEVQTRYQTQTWKAERSAETRLTGNLGAVRNVAAADDFLIFERSLDDLSLYRITLVKKSTPLFRAIAEQVGSKRWGSVGRADDTPLVQSDIDSVRSDIQEALAKPFQAFVEHKKVATRMVRARSSVFKAIVRNAHDGRCAFCGSGLIDHGGLFEVVGAHIIPHSMHGTDDPRNGVALCPRHHWAFDRGLVGVTTERRIVVPSKTLAISRNQTLQDIANKRIIEPREKGTTSHDDAFSWHRANVLQS